MTTSDGRGVRTAGSRFDEPKNQVTLADEFPELRAGQDDRPSVTQSQHRHLGLSLVDSAIIASPILARIQCPISRLSRKRGG
jgi:hypothetical protein